MSGLTIKALGGAILAITVAQAFYSRIHRPPVPSRLAPGLAVASRPHRAAPAPPAAAPPRRWRRRAAQRQRRAGIVTLAGAHASLFFCPRSGPVLRFTIFLPGCHPPWRENGEPGSFEHGRGDHAWGEQTTDGRDGGELPGAGAFLAEPVSRQADDGPRGECGGPGGERGCPPTGNLAAAKRLAAVGDRTCVRAGLAGGLLTPAGAPHRGGVSLDDAGLQADPTARGAMCCGRSVCGVRPRSPPMRSAGPAGQRCTSCRRHLPPVRLPTPREY